MGYKTYIYIKYIMHLWKQGKYKYIHIKYIHAFTKKNEIYKYNIKRGKYL